MNRYEAFLYFLVVFHICVWLYVLLAWALPYGVYHVMFILCFVLPVFYLVQSLPCHAIVYAKFMYIKKHKHHLQKLDTWIPDSYEQYIIRNIAASCKMSAGEIIDVLKYLKYYEYNLVLPRVLEHVRGKYFSGKTFENPLGAQGMLVIMFIVNITALFVMKQHCLFGAPTIKTKVRTK